jgi:hypothetical protein
MDGVLPVSHLLPCKFRQLASCRVRCIRCLREIATAQPPERVHATCLRQKPGLGDYVAKAFSAVGITKERVSKLLGRPCHCPEREEWLNQLGRKSDAAH